MTKTFTLGCSNCGEKFIGFSVLGSIDSPDELANLLTQVLKTAQPKIIPHDAMAFIANGNEAAAIALEGFCRRPQLCLFKED